MDNSTLKIIVDNAKDSGLDAFISADKNRVIFVSPMTQSKPMTKQDAFNYLAIHAAEPKFEHVEKQEADINFCDEVAAKLGIIATSVDHNKKAMSEIGELMALVKLQTIHQLKILAEKIDKGEKINSPEDMAEIFKFTN